MTKSPLLPTKSLGHGELTNGNNGGLMIRTRLGEAEPIPVEWVESVAGKSSAVVEVVTDAAMN